MIIFVIAKHILIDKGYLQYYNLLYILNLWSRLVGITLVFRELPSDEKAVTRQFWMDLWGKPEIERK